MGEVVGLDSEKEAAKILHENLGDPVVKDDDPVVPDQEDIEKPIAHKDWHVEAEYEISIRGEDRKEIFKRTYTQKPLSYIAFGEFTGLIGRKLAEAMRGPDGLSLDKLSPGEASIPLVFNDGKLSLASEGDNLIDPIVQGMAKIASYVPEFMAEAQCIWVRVPRNERPMLIDIWSRPVDEGGMSIDEGEEMLKIFIEQNYDELVGFLKRYARVKESFQKMAKRNQKED